VSISHIYIRFGFFLCLTNDEGRDHVCARDLCVSSLCLIILCLTLRQLDCENMNTGH
jgi:hypothetical protein